MLPSRIVLNHVEKPHLKVEIVFRQLVDPMPGGLSADCHWQVEAYEYWMEQPPVAMGWVSDFSRRRPAHMLVDAFDPDLECVRVFRGYDQDVAIAIIQTARLRWPNLSVETTVSDEGREAIAAFRNLNKTMWKVAEECEDA